MAARARPPPAAAAAAAAPGTPASAAPATGEKKKYDNKGRRIRRSPAPKSDPLVAAVAEVKATEAMAAAAAAAVPAAAAPGTGDLVVSGAGGEYGKELNGRYVRAEDTEGWSDEPGGSGLFGAAPTKPPIWKQVCLEPMPTSQPPCEPSRDRSRALLR